VPRRHGVVAGQRPDEPLRELAADLRLESLAGTRARLLESGGSDTMVEEAGGGFAVDGRRCGVHGSFVIGGAIMRSDPWPE
jgi:hypothetical protein